MSATLLERPREPVSFAGPTSCLPVSRRQIHERDGSLQMIEVCAGDVDLVGPATTRAEAVTMARVLLASATPRCPLPEAVHKLALAVLDFADGRHE